MTTPLADAPGSAPLAPAGAAAPASGADRGRGAGPIAAAVISLIAVGAALAPAARVELVWFAPATDVAALVALLATMVLGSMDASVRREARTTPVLVAAATIAVLATTHLLLFPGVVPVASAGYFDQWDRWVSVTWATVTPWAIVAVLARRRPPRRSGPAAVGSAIRRGMAAGMGAVLVAAVVAGLAPSMVEDRFTTAARLAPLLGALALVPGVVVSRRAGAHGAVARGVLTALVFACGVALVTPLASGRYGPGWYAEHTLDALPAAALLAGTLSLYDEAVRAEAAAAARLRAVFEGTVVGMAVSDGGGMVMECNDALVELLGRPREAIVGRHLTSFTHPADLAAEREAVAALTAGGRGSSRLEKRILRPDGSEGWVEVVLSPFPTADAQERLAIALVQDISDRRLADEAKATAAAERDRAARRLAIGVQVAAELATSLNPAEVSRRLLPLAMSATDSDRAVLAMVEGTDLILDAGATRDGAGLPAPVPGRRFPLDTHEAIERAVVTGAPAIAAGPLEWKGLPSGAEHLGETVRHLLAVPLVTDAGPASAVVVLNRGDDPPFDTDDLATGQLIGNMAALALRNARLYASAKEANLAKSRFLNMAAHELRTPLTVIAGYAAMLDDGSLGPPGAAWHRPITLITSKTHELGQLVDGLLAAARLEAGTTPLRIEELDLGEVAREAVARAAPAMQLRNGTAEAHTPSETVAVNADRESLGRILDNLILNGVTYSRHPAWVRLEVTGADGAALVRVRDGGLGIPLEMREQIFEQLVRIDRPELGYPPGTGLGLFISRGLAERMGGTLELESSSPAEGSCFLLTLPMPDPHHREAPPA